MRLTTRIEDKVYYSKGEYPPTTTISEMTTADIRECMEKLAAYEDMELDENTEDNLSRRSAMDFLKYKEEVNKKYEEYNRDMAVRITPPTDKRFLEMYFSFLTLYEVLQKHQEELEEQYYNNKHL